MKAQQVEKVGVAFTGLVAAIVFVPIVLVILFIFINGIQTISWEFLSASVTYVGQIDDDVLPDGAGAYDAEVVGMIGVGYDF